MIRKNKAENPSVEENDNTWLGSNLYHLMLVVTVVWFAIVLIYITQFFGWSNLFLMMPDEFGGFLAGATLPLALIWVGMAYVDRSAAFKREAKFLRAYMNQLVYPEEGGAATAKAMSEAIRSQVSELQEVTKLAMSQTSMIKKELDERVDDFASLVRVLDNYSTKSIVELTNGVKTLTKSFDGVTDKAFKTTKDLNNCISEFSEVAGRLQGDINGIVDNLLPGMHEIKNSADIIQNVAETSSRQIIEASENIKSYGSVSEENFNLVFEKIEAQSKYLENITEKAVASTKAVSETFRSVSSELDQLVEVRSRQAVEYAEAMDGGMQEVYRKIAEHSDLFASEAEKIIAQTALVENNISAQADELKNISDTVSESLRNAEASLTAGFDDLDERSTQAVQNLREVVDTVKVKTENLITFTDVACGKLNNGSDTIAERYRELQDVSGEVQNALDDVNARFGRSIAEVRTAVDDMTGKLNEVGDAVMMQSEKLNETGNMAVAQSRLAENSLAEQHSNISGSLAKIEEIRSELARQIEELSTAAQKIAGDTGEAVAQLRETLEDSLRASTDAADQTRKINDSLEAEVKRLDEAADAAVEKVSGLENTVAAQSDSLRSLIGDVDEHTVQIAAVMEKHADAVNEATGGFSKQFAEIVSTFESQSELFNSVAENTAGVSRTIREQIAAIGESADSVFAKMSALEEEVERRGSAVADKSNVAIDKLSEIDRAIAERILKLDQDLSEVSGRQTQIADSIVAGLQQFGQIVEQAKNGADDAAASIVNSMAEGLEQFNRIAGQTKNDAGETADQIVERLGVGLESFNRAISDSRAGSDDAAAAIAENTARIREVHQAFGSDFTTLAGEMEGYASRIDGSVEQIRNQGVEINRNFGALLEQMQLQGGQINAVFNNIGEQIKAQSAVINDNFSRQREDLMDAVNLVSAQTRLGEAALNQQYKCLMDVSDAVSHKMNGLSEQFKTDVNGLYDNAARLAGEVSALSERLLQIGDSVQKTAGNSIADIEHVNQALALCSEDLNRATDNAAANMNKVAEDYQQCLTGFNAVAGDAGRSLTEATGLIAVQNDKMVQISEDTKALVDYFNGLMNNASDQLIDKANLAHDKIRELGESLQSLSRQLEEAAGSSAQHFAASGDSLRSTIIEIMSNAERISGEIKAANEVFAQQSDSLQTTADETLSKVSDVMGTFSGSLEEFTAKSNAIVASTDSFNGVIKKQIELLDIGAKQAGSELAEIEKRYREMKVENFLKNATSIIEKLETLAVDINMIFNPESQDKLWQKYYEGDTDVFVRYLSRTMSRKQVIAIKEEFERNAEFRKMVNAYTGEFEELINRARSCEKSGILLSVISGADIGKIYYVIARALDKLN